MLLNQRRQLLRLIANDNEGFEVNEPLQASERMRTVGVRRGGIARTGTVQYAQPLVTVVLAALFLRESITWPLLAAGAIIVAGIAIAQRR